MSCMLRISGVDLDIQELLRNTSLVAESSYRRGDPKFKKKRNGKKYDNSGASFLVSMADFDDFDTQRTGAMVFLKVNRKEVRRIMTWPGVDGGSLDFGIYHREVPVQCDSFPPELVKAAADAGLGIELSQYPVDEKD